ncbi:MAG: L-serine dehydratase, partial [Eubacteriaceae bacterium]|nr:L-serine dehydratase [Eubacteriaceae bacterium]
MITYDSIQSLIDQAVLEGKLISQIVLIDKASQMEMTDKQLLKKMNDNLQVMKEAVLTGLESESKSVSGLSGGDAKKMMQSISAGRSIGGHLLSEVI